MLYADFIAFTGLYTFILPVYVIELQLHQFCFRVVSQDTVQHIRIIMVRKSDMPYLSLCFFAYHKLKTFLLLYRPIHGPSHGMKEVIICLCQVRNKKIKIFIIYCRFQTMPINVVSLDLKMLLAFQQT